MNPDHLEAVTHQENIRRASSPREAMVRHWEKWREERPNCPKGHEYTPENTMSYSYKPRQCRECNRQRSAEWRARRDSEFLN